MRSPHGVTKEFEAAVAEYTGAKYVVAVNSCTAALMLAVKWYMPRGWFYAGDPRSQVEIPARTYVSVPMAIIHAGGRPTFRDEVWRGTYQLKPYPVWDSARLFTSGMCVGVGPHSTNYAPFRNLAGEFVCVSFHASKTLGLEQGGAILHDNDDADAWFRRMRFDGRTEGVAPKDDDIREIGYHCYMNPSTAAQGILRLHSLPKHNEPLPNDEYPDLSRMEIFK